MIRNWFKTKTDSLESQQSSAVLRVIGDRGSGKTAYMASLARWPNADPTSPVQTVIPVGEAGEELITKAQNILEQGLELEATDLAASTTDIKDYTLRISLKGQFSWNNLKGNIGFQGSQLVNLNISSKDYAGEFFSDLLYRAGNPQLREYLEDCSLATGIMFLVDGSSRAKDSEYANGLDKFITSLDRTDMGLGKRRIAFVLT